MQWNSTYSELQHETKLADAEINSRLNRVRRVFSDLIEVLTTTYGVPSGNLWIAEHHKVETPVDDVIAAMTRGYKDGLYALAIGMEVETDDGKGFSHTVEIGVQFLPDQIAIGVYQSNEPDVRISDPPRGSNDQLQGLAEDILREIRRRIAAYGKRGWNEDGVT